MPKQSAETRSPALLRVHAEEKLSTGAAPATRGWLTGTHALALLHKLADTPDGASDALKLLHELQVHQVELDLQQEETDQTLRELAQDRDHYASLFEMAPLGYLTIDFDGRVIEANRMARQWLGLKDGPCDEPFFFELLKLECRPSFKDALSRLGQGSSGEAMAIQLSTDGSGFFLNAAPTSGGQLVLMAFMPLSPASGH